MPSTSNPIRFDYAGARKAGFSDEEIAASLAAKRAAGLNVFVDRAEVSAVRNSVPTESGNPFQRGYNPGPTRAQESGVGADLSILPAAGGFLGGLAGGGEGPLAVGGATIGGGAGEGARQLFSGEPFSAKRIGLEAAGQGGAQAVGGLLAKGAGALAKPLMRRALAVGRSLPGFSNTAETALQEGITASKGGLAKAQSLGEQSAQSLETMLAEARATGKTLNTRRVLQPVRNLLRSNVIPDEDKAAIMRKLVSFLGDKTARIDPLVLQEIKQYWGQRAKAIYAPAGRRLSNAAKLAVAPFETALTTGSRQQLETIPGVASQNLRTQNLMGVERAVERAVTRHPGAIELHKPGSYLGPVLGGSHALSRAALMLNSPLFKAVLRQSPRAAAAMIYDIGQSEPDQTSVSP